MKKKLPGDGSRGINTASIENNGERPQKSKNKTSINLTAVYGAKENDISLSNCSHCKIVKYNTQDTEPNSMPVTNELMKIHSQWDIIWS